MSSDLVNLYIQQYEQYSNETDDVSKDNFKKLNYEVYSMILQDLEITSGKNIYLISGYKIVNNYIQLSFIHSKDNCIYNIGIIDITYFISKFKLNENNNIYIDKEYQRYMTKELYENIINSLNNN